MRSIKLTSLLFVLITFPLFSQIYVAPDGNDSNPGTFNQPFESIQKAQESASAGDTVFIRGGTYQIREDQISRVVSNLFACISYLDKSGTEGNTIKYWAYPGETPVFDFSNVKPANQRVAGIYIVGSYIHIKGLEMTGVQVTITSHTESYCIYSRGNNNMFELISMHDNVGTGLRHYKGGDNLFLNCDSYRNHDNVSEDKLGSNNDGFGCHPDPGSTGNVFRGCRAWFNSDDGFDIIRADESVVFDSCWSFYNGYTTSFNNLGDGNGFKAGGYAHDAANQIPNPVPRNTIEFCIAVRNKASGFFSNHHLSGNYWYNNSAYRNETNFNMVNRESPAVDNIWVNGYDHVLKNNLGYKARVSETAYIDTAQNTLSHNSFDLDINITDEDFVSLDESQLTKPRKSDGSLPDFDFMRPAQGSDLIDAGTDIGFEFLGKAPELGAIEVNYPTGVRNDEKIILEKITLFQNYPNPFNPTTIIHYSIPNVETRHPANAGQVTSSLHVVLKIYDLLGREVTTLVNEFRQPGTYSIQLSAVDLQLSSGVYFYMLQVTDLSLYPGQNFSQTKKMIVLK